MQLTFDRFGVHAGEDTHPHDVTITLPDDATLADAIDAMWQTGFLPHFQGDEPRGRWTVRSDGNDVARVRAAETVYLVDADTPVKNLSGTLFFA
jgi:hypothetical protein